jgi:hypothetical protein
LKLMALVALAVTLQACAIAPGMTMSEPAELPDGEVIRVQSVTSELLNELEVRRQSTVREIAEEFATYCRLQSGITRS